VLACAVSFVVATPVTSHAEVLCGHVVVKGVRDEVHVTRGVVSCAHAFSLVRSYLRTNHSPRGWRCRKRPYAVLLDCRRDAKIITVYDTSYGE
jgi:hypothetical protein